MNRRIEWIALALASLALAACGMPTGDNGADHDADEHGHGAEDAAADFERGPHGGRMLRDGDFAVELAIIEAGIPPEFRAWVSAGGAAVDPAAVSLTVTLSRLGAVDEIGFAPRGDYLRGDREVYEPHSFAVAVDARHGGQSYRFDYDSFEGRTQIEPDIAEAMGIGTGIAGPARLVETITVYGRIVPLPERIRELGARFDGAIESVDVALGQRISAGQRLAVIESDESLRSYSIEAPIAGVVTERAANPGEQTRGRRLFTIVDSSEVWAELAIFPGDRPRVAVGQSVRIAPATGGEAVVGTIAQLNPLSNADQSVTARVVVANADGRFAIGSYVTATIGVAEFDVPLAVRRSGLQAFRDFTVVFAVFDDQYEVRMLEPGRQDAEFLEVLGGIDAGTRYVTDNSYLLKADVEKAGAGHDH